ncbi:MAG: hybrid sensor histidine kinase/response regulator [Verrucomicrobia bacterium]|nr:MAG: hybrid sensor histidine kinase/response regulator [Verrucomicrobiota bacterium]
MIWRSLSNLSIKRKLVLMIMGVSLCALLLMAGAFVAYELFTFRLSMSRDLGSLAELIGNQSTASLRFGDDANAQEILHSLAARPHIVTACLYRQGKVFAHYSRDVASKDLPPRRPEPNGSRFERKHLVLFHQVVFNGEELGQVYLKSDLLEWRERLVRYTEIIVPFVLLSSLVALVLSAMLQRVISAPLSELAGTARSVSLQKNYSVRATQSSDDELGQLIGGFNEMLEQIQARDAALQQAHDRLEKRVQERTQALEAEVAERAQAQQGMRQQLTHISLLNKITQVISERQDLTRIQQVVLRQLEEHLHMDMGLIGFYEPDSERLKISALRQLDVKGAAKLDLIQGGFVTLTASAHAHCMSGKTLYVPDTRQVTGELAQHLAAAGIFCTVKAPLTVEGKFFGLLIVARSEPDSFSSGECEFLRMLSEQVSLAVHQARLHQQLETAYNELRQTQQAVMQQDRLRALGQMASGIAHDINNALAPVVGFSQMVLQHEPDLSQNAIKQLTYIRTAGEDIAHIVARLREFYRRREEREPVHPVDLNRLVEQVIEMTRPRWRDIPQGKGIMVEVQTQLTSGLPAILGLESELREALTNLILNALDAMPNGGQVLIGTRLSPLPHVEQDGSTYAILEVADNGIGMDTETRQRCLEPFFSTKGTRGTGLGLAMVYGVMERHEGRIEINSQLGQGTSIQLFLPLPRKAKVLGQNPEEILPPPPLRILCIDDEPLLRELLKEVLEADGHTVQTADGGQTGIDAFRVAAERNRSFDVIITDLGMPFVDGRQVAKTLKAESPRTPIVMLTGWGAFMRADGDIPEHVDGLLSKPPRVRELREILGRLATVGKG